MKGLRSFVWGLILAFSVAAVTWAADLPSASPENLGFSSERLARIGPVIKGEIKRRQYPGAVILIARKGQIVYFESVGQLDPASRNLWVANSQSSGNRGLKQTAATLPPSGAIKRGRSR